MPPIVLDLAGHLRAWRKRRELTAATAAQMRGVNLRTYQGLEQGRPCPYGYALTLATRALDEGAGT